MERRCETLFLGKVLLHGVVHGEKWPFSEDSLLSVKRFPSKGDEPDLGTVSTVRAAWFPT